MLIIKMLKQANGTSFVTNAEIIKKYISNDRGKILPRRITGACAKHQRHIANEVKKARFMALIPFVK